MSQLSGQRTFSYGGISYVKQITLQVPGDGFIVVASYRKNFPLDTAVVVDFSSSVLLLRISSNYDTLWSKEIKQFQFSDAILTKDNNMVLVGVAYKLLATYTSGVDFSIIRISVNGLLINQKSFKMDTDLANNIEYFPRSLATTAELLNGQIFVLYKSTFSESQLGYKTYFLRLSAQLDLLASKLFSVTSPINNPIWPDVLSLFSTRAIIPIDTNKIVLSTSNSDISYYSLSSNESNRIMEVDTNMNILANSRLDDFSGSITDVDRINSNQYLVCYSKIDSFGYSLYNFFAKINFGGEKRYASVGIKNKFKQKLGTNFIGISNFILKGSIYSIINPGVFGGLYTNNTIETIFDSTSYNFRYRIVKLNPDLSVSWYQRLHVFGFSTGSCSDLLQNCVSNSFYKPFSTSINLLLNGSSIILAGSKYPFGFSNLPPNLLVPLSLTKKQTGLFFTKLDTSGVSGNCNLTEESFDVIQDSVIFETRPIPVYTNSSFPELGILYKLDAFPVKQISDTCLPLKKAVSAFYLQPSSSFGFSDSIVCKESGVSFTELSYNEPRTWNWIFSPEADLSSADSSNFPDLYNVKFTSVGEFPTKLVTTNAAGSDTLTRYIQVINFIPQPNMGNDTTLCQGDSLLIIYRNPPNSRHYFTSYDVTDVFTESDTLIVRESGNYICAAYTSCGYKYDTISVNYTKTPIALFNDSSACNRPEVFFKDSSILNGNPSLIYSWNFFNLANQLIGTSNQQNPIFIFPRFDSFYVRLIVSGLNTCSEKDSITKRIFLPPPPVAAFTIADTCAGSTIRLQNISTGANISSYKWLFGNGDSSTAQVPLYNYPAAGNYTIRLNIITADNCTASATQTISIKATPLAAFSITESCLGKAISFVNNSSGSISSYNWLASDGQSFTGSNPAISFNNEGNYSLKLKVQSASGCSDSISKPITINAIKITASADTSILINQPLQLTASGAVNYVWQPAALLNNATGSNPVFKTASSGLYPILVQGTTAQGCKGTAAINITVYNTKVGLLLPNAFSPNGDNINEVFRFNCTGLQSLSYFRIFNRYGQAVYEQRSCANSQGWNGTYKGILQNPGAYIYQWQGVDFEGKLLNGKGTVMLLR